MESRGIWRGISSVLGHFIFASPVRGTRCNVCLPPLTLAGADVAGSTSTWTLQHIGHRVVCAAFFIFTFFYIYAARGKDVPTPQQQPKITAQTRPGAGVRCGSAGQLAAAGSHRRYIIWIFYV